MCLTRRPLFVFFSRLLKQFRVAHLASSRSTMAATPLGEASIPDTKAKMDLQDTKSSWYDQKLKSLGSSGRELLENYGNIPAAEVEDHVYKMVGFLLSLFRRD